MCLYLSWEKSAWELFLVSRKGELSTVLKPCFKTISQLIVFNFETNEFRLLFLKHTTHFFCFEGLNIWKFLCVIWKHQLRISSGEEKGTTSSRERVRENEFSTADRRSRLFGMCSMGWLRLLGSLKLWVSFAEEPYKRDDILQKRPVILRSLLIVATPYSVTYNRICRGGNLRGNY